MGRSARAVRQARHHARAYEARGVRRVRSGPDRHLSEDRQASRYPAAVTRHDNIKKAAGALSIGIALCAGAFAGPALAQSYPSKPVKILVGFAAGGPTDVIARIVAQDMTVSL